MTVLDDRHLVDWGTDWVRPVGLPRRPETRVGARRPYPVRPRSVPLRYRGSGVPMSRTPHGRRTVSTPITLALAGLAALITFWLGSIAHFSSDLTAEPAAAPDQLAVVRVQAGETLQGLAERIAPGAPAGQVVQRILDLNRLDSAAVDAGQTLIAPIN